MTKRAVIITGPGFTDIATKNGAVVYGKYPR